MRILYIVFIFSLSSNTAHTQEANIIGRILNKDLSPLENATVVLLKNATEPPLLVVEKSNNEGRVNFKNISVGDYILKINLTGYDKKEIPIQYLDSSIDLGNIILELQNNNLDEVVITKSSVSSFADKKIYRLSDIDKKSSANSLDALKFLPRMIVSPDNQLLTTNGEIIKILLNNINATEADLMSLSPENIVRVEYYQTPPPRFAQMGIGAVINVITKDNIKGGMAAINLHNAVTTGFGNDLVSFKYNLDNTQFGVKYSLKYRDYDQRTVNESLKYNFNDNEYNKNKIGYDSPYSFQLHLLELNFINQKKDNYVFSTTLTLNKFNHDIETGQNIEQKSPTTMFNSALNSEQTKYLNPTADIYFNKTIGEKQEFLANAVLTYYDTSFSNEYTEKTETNDTNFHSSIDINSKKYSSISDLMYSYSFKKEKLSAGVRNMYSSAKQNVNTTQDENTESNQNDIYGYLELKGSLSKFTYSLSLGVNSSTFNSYSLDKDYAFLYFRPIANFRYNINAKSDVSASYQINTRNPLLSELSNNPVMQDNYFAYSGNPNLEPFKTHSVSFSYNFQTDKISLYSDFAYDYSENPILPNFIMQPNYILQTYSNFYNAQKYSLDLYARWFPFKAKWLRLQCGGQVFSIRNSINDFALSHNDYRIIPSVFIQVKKWGGTLFYQSSTEILNGQLIKSSPSAAFVELTYKPIKNMTALMGIRYPFYDAYKTYSKTDDSALVYRDISESIKDNANMIYFLLNYNFTFGKQSKDVKKKVNNTDKDNGIYSISN